MNKMNLIEALKKETGLSKAKSADVVDLFFAQMTDALSRDDRGGGWGLQHLCKGL